MIYFAIAVFAVLFGVVAYEAVRIMRMTESDYLPYLRRARATGRFTGGVVAAPIGWLLASLLALSTALTGLAATIVTSMGTRILTGSLFLLWMLATTLALTASYRGRPKVLLHPTLRAGWTQH